MDRLLARDPVEQRLGLEQVDAAVDEVQERRHGALLLHLLLDEPLHELERPVVLRVPGGVGQRLELRGDLGLARLGDLDRLAGGPVDRGGAADLREAELDVVVDEERR